MTNTAPPWIVKPLVAEEVYTDRAETQLDDLLTYLGLRKLPMV